MGELDRARLDAWITREPPWEDEDEVDRTCASCGGPLQTQPDRSESWEDSYECDGKITIVHGRYNRDDDAGILNIIGWEHEGEEYEASMGTSCGDDEAHDPHKVVLMDGVRDYRRCPACGHVNVETVI